MTDVYTDGTQWSHVLAGGYDRYLEFQLRSTPIFRQMVDKHPQDVTNPGPTVTLTIVQEFANLATTPLTDSTDIATVAPPNPNQVTVTVNEYGNADLQTLRLRDLSFAQVEPAVANVLGKNMVDTLDALVRTTLDGATHVIGKNATVVKTETTSFAEGSVAAGDNLDDVICRDAVALLRRRNAQARDMRGAYLGVIHPDVSVDIRANANWLAPHQYVDTANIYNGEVGQYLGTRFVESPRATVVADGASSAKVYRTYFLGAQALVEATVREPHIVIGPQIDRLRRFFPIGWYAHAGWAIYRQEPIQVARSTSSISTL